LGFDLPGACFVTFLRLAAAGYASIFPSDVSRRLVLPPAEEARVAQLVVGCPLGEPDLSDEPWLDPMHAALLHLCAKGRIRDLEPRKLSAQPL
jgi:hypothetical protein